MNDEYVKKLEKRNEELEAANRFFSSIIGVNIIRNIKDDNLQTIEVSIKSNYKRANVSGTLASIHVNHEDEKTKYCIYEGGILIYANQQPLSVKYIEEEAIDYVLETYGIKGIEIEYIDNKTRSVKSEVGGGWNNNADYVYDTFIASKQVEKYYNTSAYYKSVKESFKNLLEEYIKEMQAEKGK